MIRADWAWWYSRPIYMPDETETPEQRAAKWLEYATEQRKAVDTADQLWRLELAPDDIALDNEGFAKALGLLYIKQRTYGRLRSLVEQSMRKAGETLPDFAKSATWPRV